MGPGHGLLACDEAQRQADRLLEEGDLKEIERDFLFEHLRACPQCRPIWERRKRLDQRIRAVFAALDTRDDFTARCMERLQHAEAPANAYCTSASRHSLRLQRWARTRPLRAMLRQKWWWLVLPLFVLLGILGASGLHRVWTKKDGTRAQLTSLSGSGLLTRGKQSRPLEPGLALQMSDRLENSTTELLEFTLLWPDWPPLKIRLAPGSALRLQPEGWFYLEPGEACFQTGPFTSQGKQAFLVGCRHGYLRFIEGSFGVSIPQEGPEGTLVLVEKGSLDAIPLQDPVNLAARCSLRAGQELFLFEDKLADPQPIQAGRLMRLRAASAAKPKPALE